VAAPHLSLQAKEGPLAKGVARERGQLGLLLQGLPLGGASAQTAPWFEALFVSSPLRALS
jgi:hypothetical protein